MRFSDRYIAKLQPRETRFEVLEGDGFTLRVTPAGVKSFYYVYKDHGKNYRLHLGTYPHCSLSEARERHRAAVSARFEGENPAQARRAERQERLLAPTVEELADEYIKRHAKPNKKSWEKDEYILGKDVIPAWGNRKAADIRRRDVILLLESIFDRGAPNQSRQVLKIIRRMFNFAIERDILEASPCHLVKPLAPDVKKARTLSEEEIRLFWKTLDSGRISEPMRRGLRTILVTAQRPGEVFGMLGEEVSGPWWTIPAGRSKNGREHRVWLTGTAQALIGNRDQGIIFPGRDREGREVLMQGDAPARAVRRLRTPQGKNKVVRMKVPAFTPHDLRRTAATHIGALGYGDDQIGRLLNHTPQTVTGIYNRHRYDDLVREMLQAWEARLLEILQEPTNQPNKPS